MLENAAHEHFLLRYSVEIEDKPIHHHSQTSVLSFFDENNKIISVTRLGFVTKEEIYSLIEKKEIVNLDSSYVKNFSLSEYRMQQALGDETRIAFKNFSAKKAFFDCDEEVDFSHSEFDGGKTNFESAAFGNGNINFSNSIFLQGDVSFKKVKFGDGNLNFQSTRFSNGVVSFHNTNFGAGDVNFRDVNFGDGNVDFKNSIFGDGEVDFKFSKFGKGEVTFERTCFGKGHKDFKNVEFGGGKIDFKRIDFNEGNVSFDGVEFGDGKVSFMSSTFGEGIKLFERADFAKGEVQFDKVNFGTGSVNFNKARAENITFRGCHLNCYVDLRFEHCTLVDLSNTIVRDILDVKPESEKVVILKMKFVDMRILGRIFIDWRSNDVKELIYNQVKTSLFQKSEQFRILKENFHINGQYEDEDAAYLEFKRCESKASLANALQENKRNAIWAYPTYYFQKYVFDFIGRYATAPTRVLANCFVAIGVYGLVYFLMTHFLFDVGHVSSSLPTQLGHVTGFSNCIYYSAITFFTIGYGDYFPEGLLKLFAVFEGFSGVFLMSYFTVAFVRKILR